MNRHQNRIKSNQKIMPAAPARHQLLLDGVLLSIGSIAPEDRRLRERCEAIVGRLGGRVAHSPGEARTVVYHAGMPLVRDSALARGTPVVTPEWLLECDRRGGAVADLAAYAVASPTMPNAASFAKPAAKPKIAAARPAPKAKAATAAAAVPLLKAGGRRRQRSADDDDDDEPSSASSTSCESSSSSSSDDDGAESDSDASSCSASASSSSSSSASQSSDAAPLIASPKRGGGARAPRGAAAAASSARNISVPATTTTTTTTPTPAPPPHQSSSATAAAASTKPRRGAAAAAAAAAAAESATRKRAATPASPPKKSTATGKLRADGDADGGKCDTKTATSSPAAKATTVLRGRKVSKAAAAAAAAALMPVVTAPRGSAPGAPRLIAVSGMARVDRELFYEIVEQLGSRVSEDGGFGRGAEKPSHVVASGDTLSPKLMIALALGLPVMDPAWVFRSLEAGRWLPERDFFHPFFDYDDYVRRQQLLVQHDTHMIRCEPERGPLFLRGRVLYFLGTNPYPGDAAMRELAEMVGARVVRAYSDIVDFAVWLPPSTPRALLGAANARAAVPSRHDLRVATACLTEALAIRDAGRAPVVKDEWFMGCLISKCLLTDEHEGYDDLLLDVDALAAQLLPKYRRPASQQQQQQQQQQPCEAAPRKTDRRSQSALQQPQQSPAAASVAVVSSLAATQSQSQRVRARSSAAAGNAASPLQPPNAAAAAAARPSFAAASSATKPLAGPPSAVKQAQNQWSTQQIYASDIDDEE